jgi:hypothetical protein
LSGSSPQSSSLTPANPFFQPIGGQPPAKKIKYFKEIPAQLNLLKCKGLGYGAGALLQLTRNNFKSNK